MKLFEKYNKYEAITSFRIKDELNPEIWDGYKIDKNIREQLLEISKDFFNNTEINTEIIDIVLCGSLCNYNWSKKYSDFDLHIIIKYKDVNQDTDLVEKLCDMSKKVWNNLHDIKISGYDVEVAIQDSDDLRKSIEEGRMGGVFSLMRNKWIKKPKKVNFRPDEKLIKEKSKTIMMKLDDLEEKSAYTNYDEMKEELSNIWGKIKKLRKQSLLEEGEYGLGNLIFKFLRRNGYLEKILDIKLKLYDKKFK